MPIESFAALRSGPLRSTISWRSLLRVVTAALLAVLSAGSTPLTEDPPPLPAPKSGDITGTVGPAGKVTGVSAVSRATGKAFSPSDFESSTGKFTFKGLPGDATYDLCLTTADRRSIEGIDLDFADARMLRLAELRRKQLGLPAEPQHEFTAQDAAALQDWVKKLDDFMELKRVLYVQGHGGRASVLVELMRTRDFYSGKGQLIWRVELWYFQYAHGGWERLANQEVVLRRERTTPDQWRKIDVEYYPQLSVHIEADGASQAVEFTIPDKPDPSTGRPAGTSPELTTQTHVLGVKEPATASAPATK